METGTPTFVLSIPALHPGTVAFEVAADTSELETAYFRTVERAQLHGTPTDVETAERAYGRVHERVYTAAFIRMRRRTQLRPSHSGPRRPRCRAPRPRPRSHRRRGGGRGSGRGGGSDDGAGDPDPPDVAPNSDEEVGRG